MNHLARITYSKDIFNGKPIIRGMRIRVQDVLELLGSGMSESEILNDFPYLELEDIKACLQYAARKISHPVIHVS